MWANAFLEALDEDRYEAFMLLGVPGGVEPSWLISRIGRGLGLEELPKDRSAMLASVYGALVEVQNSHRRVVVLVDEAQALCSAAMLGEIQALLNLEHDDKGVLTLILVGQPELRTALAADRVLRHRVDIRTELTGLESTECKGYLVHRLEAAGGRAELIDSEALTLIGELGEGMPRRINTLADNAMFEAELLGESILSERAVRKAATDLGIEENSEVFERIGDLGGVGVAPYEEQEEVVEPLDLEPEIPSAYVIEDEDSDLMIEDEDPDLMIEEEDTVILGESESIASEPIELDELLLDPQELRISPPKKDEEDEFLDTAFADLLDH